MCREANDAKKLQIVSRRFRILLQTVMFVIPLANGLFWISANQLPEFLQRECLPYAEHFPLPWPAQCCSYAPPAPRTKNVGAEHK